MQTPPTIAVVDDDQSIRESLPDLLRELGFEAQAFSSAEEFLNARLEKFQCMILDIAMPGMSGPELQKHLKGIGYDIPIIFITARKDEVVTRGLIDEGAVECLYKPFTDTALHRALEVAFGNN
jgi:FixJ family two-component response regulator